MLTPLLLAACHAPHGVTPPDTGSGPAPDSTTDSAVDSDTSAEDTDDSEGEPGDSGTVYLTSEDTIDAGGCTEVLSICDDDGCPLDIDLTTISVSGALPDNGTWGLRFTDPRVDIGSENPLHGNGYGLSTPFGSSTATVSGSTYEIRTFPGVYDVSLEFTSMGEERRQHYPLSSATSFEGDSTFDVDLAFHSASGALTVGGMAITGGWYLRFEDATTGGYARFWGSGSAFDVQLPDGTWDVTFEPQDDAQVPEGTWPAGTLVVAGADVATDLDAEAFPISGTLTLGGVPLSEVAYMEGAVLTFRNEAGETWDVVLSGRTDWSTWLPAGVFEASLAGVWVVGQDVVVSGPTVVDLADAPVHLDGTFTVDGGPPDGWHLEFVDPSSEIAYGVSSESWTADVHAGVYDVYVSHEDYLTGTVRTRIASDLPIATDTTLTFPVELSEITSVARWNGLRLATDWRVILIDVASGEQSLFYMERGDWAGAVPYGTYDIYVSHGTGDQDPYAPVARGLQIDRDLRLDLSATTRTVGGSFRVDGASAEGGGVYWHDEADGDTLDTSIDADADSWAVNAPLGVYTFLTHVNAVDSDHLIPVAVCVGIDP